MNPQTITKRFSAARIVVVIILALLTSVCAPPTRGYATDTSARLAITQPAATLVWIENPMEGQTLPLAALPIVVYASDAQSVFQIDLRVNGKDLPAGAPKPATANGSRRLVRVDQPWTPDKPGQYIVEARARGASGASSQPATVKFCIVACQPATLTPTPVPGATGTPTPAALPSTPTPTATQPSTPTPTATLPPTPTRTATSPPPPLPGVTINFRSDAPYVNAGQCTTLRWDVENVQAIYLDNQSVTGHGTQQACLCQPKTYTLRVIKRDNSAEDRQVTITVYGTCAAPPAPPTTAVPPPPRDTTGPSIGNVGLRWESCKFIGIATITDPSSVPQAQFWYNLNGGGWNSIGMFPRGGGNWEANSGVSVMTGIGSPMGSVQYYVTATDGAGNQSKSGTSTKNYTGCGG